MSEQFSPPEQALIERLRRAPQQELSPEVREAIHARMITAFENPISAPQPILARPFLVVAIVIIGLLVVAGVMLVLSQPSAVVIPTPTVTVSPTVIPATATPIATMSPVPSATSTVTASPTVTPILTLEPTATQTTSTISIIEGPVEQINGNIITVFDIPVQLAPTDPLLPIITVGDIVRVEGNTQIVDGQLVVVVITITINNADVNTDPATGAVWQDDGTCANPPPAWAPAHGWRRRCQGQTNNNQGNNGQGQNNQGNNGQGKNDEDDD